MKRHGVAIGSLAGCLALGGALWLWSAGGERALPLAPRAAVTTDAITLQARERPAEPSGERTRVLEPESPAAPRPEPSHDGATAPSRLRGTLLDADTQLPLAGHQLDLLPVFQRKPARRTATTDVSGVFEVDLEPGEYLALYRAEAGDGERAISRELAPQRFEISRRSDGAPCEQIFLARRPPGVLDVEVRYGDGRPAAGALVSFACTMEVLPFADPQGRTDDAGRARIAVWELEAFTDGQLTACDDAGQVSEVVSVPAPFVPGLRRLVLAPGARLNVSVLAADHAPVAGRRVLLTGEQRFGPRLYGETDAAGALRYDGLIEGAYTFSAWLPESSDWERRPVALARGEEQWLEVVLPSPREPLAAAGVVLDEQEQPLAGVELAFRLGNDSGTLSTAADGTFRLHGAPSERVWLAANVIQQSDQFEPAEIDAVFGAQSLVFRRVARAERRIFEVEVYDSITGRELEHFVATIDRGPGTEEWSDSYAPRRKFDLRLLPDARWQVKSHGYIARELRITEAVDALEPGERLRIGLDPGLDHTFQICDASTLAPIPDALLHSPTAGEARSNAAGRVHLVADHWSIYRVTKDGYAPQDWDPDFDLLWGRGPYLLDR